LVDREDASCTILMAIQTLILYWVEVCVAGTGRFAGLLVEGETRDAFGA
jgi:hypothetical protein